MNSEDRIITEPDRAGASSAALAEQPAVAALVLCRNEAAYIRACLDSLLAGTFDPERLEILVLDGMSTDGTRQIVQGFASRHPKVRLIDNPSGTKPDALNLGIRLTQADIVMRVDAHAVYPSDYVERLVDGLRRNGADNIGGVRKTYEGKGAVEQAIAAGISHPFAAGNAYWRTGSVQLRRVDTVFCGCYRRDAFDRVGLFNPRLLRAQDREFNARLRAAGGVIVLDPAVQCTYFPRRSLRAHWHWTVEGAFWLFYARRFTRTRMISARNLVPLAFVGYHLVPPVAALWVPGAVKMALLGPVAVYWLVAAAVAGGVAIKKRRLIVWPLTLLVFAATHYGYGIGGWAGLIKALVEGRHPERK
jgi:glycosyltransferase involved in cell wall biosynthesis